MSIGGGGGTQTSTTVNQADPRIWDTVSKNVNRATGIADQPFQAYTGNPYAGLQGSGGSPPVSARWEPGVYTGTDEYGNPQYGDPTYIPGDPGTPGTSPTFDPSNFVAPLSGNQNMAINAAPGLLGAGQGATNAGIQGAAGLLNYRPNQINPATAGTATAGAQGYNPSLLGQAPQTQAAGYNASLTGAAPQVTATGYDASLLGNAPQMQAAQTGPASGANFTTANASQINRGSVGNVGANSGLGGIPGYENPYTSQVVDAALRDIDTQRQRSIGQNTDRAIFAGAQNGSRAGVADSLTNETYGKLSAQTAAQLRAAGFDTAAQLSQQDAARAQQAQGQNQNADLSVASQNANALNNNSQFNSQGLFGASQFNAGANNAFTQANADRSQSAGANNQNLLAQYGLANQGATNAASAYGAGAANDASRVNAGLLSTNQLANQGALNQAGQYNATNAQNTGQFNAGLLSQYGLANQGAQNTAGQFNAGAGNAVNLANMAALNQGGQFNAGAVNDAQARNQSAGLAGAGINANAAGLLGTLGGQQQSLLGNAINTLGATGALQQGNTQAGLDAAWQEFMRRQNYDPQMQALINQSLGLLPQGGTTTQTGPRQDTSAQTLGGFGGLLSGIGAIGDLFSDGRLKEDLAFDGYDNEGRRWYTYRYIWDEHGMRRRGVIAQEVMESDPEAVSVHPSGYLMVNYSKLVRH